MNRKRKKDPDDEESGGETKYKKQKIGRLVDRNCHLEEWSVFVMQVVTKSRQEKSISVIVIETRPRQASETLGKVILIIPHVCICRMSLYQAVNDVSAAKSGKARHL